MNKESRRRIHAGLVREMHGNLSAIARWSGEISRQAISRRLRGLGLLELAAKERARHGVPGYRVGYDPKREIEKIDRAVRSSPSHELAAKRLGISRRTLDRKIARYGIDP